MQVMRRGKGCGNGSAVRATALPTVAALVLGAASAALVSGCSSISTPLPEIKPAVSTAMSQKDKQKAVEDLNKIRDSHEQDAEKQIEQSR